MLRERREHARGNFLSNCKRICGSPRKSVESKKNVEEISQMINNMDNKGYIGKKDCGGNAWKTVISSKMCKVFP